MIKKFVPLLALSLLAWSAHAQQKLVVGASPVPHAEILEQVVPVLKQQGIDLEIKEFTDYVLPNTAVEEKQLDANYFQHQPYLDSFNADRKTSIVAVPGGGIHVEPFGAYSKKIKAIDELRDGAIVAIPNDPTNSGRALLLLDKFGVIKLKDHSKISATPADIAENPKKLQFRELEAAILPRALDDVDLALINTNYALEAGLVPTQDALLIEGGDSVYANFIATRADRVNDPAIGKLVQALRTPEVKAFIETKYKGAIVPAF
ncbi:ABC transporter substrate-binding protein [Corticibacter populi]|uniref:ABC transporter substrate-binding protein n=1 Tax=Corticibacter populi TaxID=1550736 RepID=A0A3M6QNH0_9BURK|nr:MetQ/NlpA family ABC transporter substrate-binding protein [Corticibacter populi]RMX04069.1 ABC transporter substrate-binding protein [Corticibacter populi]RZS33075.1 D-methionine transport system substrate-binding protein [Corticibacter populi]